MEIGSYFMSQEQEDAVVVRVIREHAEADKKLALLEPELRRYREMFASLAQRLGDVDSILFDEDQWPESLRMAAGWKMSEYRFSSDAIDGQKLKTLCREIKETKARRARLASELKNLGL
jgi:hypothetical protein